MVEQMRSDMTVEEQEVKQGPPASKEPSFWKELSQLLNKHGIDAKLGVPDWALANFVSRSLEGLGKVQDAVKESTSEPERAF